MTITKKEFEKYERVRMSAVTNMWDVKVVERLSGLNRNKILEIIENYTMLAKDYPDVRNNPKLV